MRRQMGIALTSALLSVTVGILVGAVITLGSKARSEPVQASLSAAQSSGVVDTAISVATWAVTGDPTASAAPAVTASVPPTSAALSPPPTPLIRSAPAGRTPASAAPVPTAQTTRAETGRTVPAPSSLSYPGVWLTTVTVIPTGSPVAGRPCATLGLAGTATGGATVFCQHNPADRTLAWRAVVDGGGCLNRHMLGWGVDGRRYACRPDGPAMDRWRPVR